MRTIAHLSDLHFGRVDEQLVEPLIAGIRELRPDLVAISGELTQRARTREFTAARDFLERLPKPQIVVPGNHDVPLYNLLARFHMPLAKYQLHITADLEPFYSDEEIAVAGVNTARSLTRKGGRINRRQIASVSARLCSAAPHATRIIVTHHPFDVPIGHAEADLVGHARLAMEAWAACGADLFLSGHLHVSHTSRSAERYRIAGHSALVVQAGTTISTRGRGEANAFNVLRVERGDIRVERFEWGVEGGRFALTSAEHFVKTNAGWQTAHADSAQPPAKNAPM
jgi:3',5'-cyclic AMP phosphodiesterase CpdA